MTEGDFYWFTEGFDDFLSHRVMPAVGLLSDTGYVSAINRDLAGHALSAARDSSWSAVVRGFWRDPALQQEPYSRGELVALALNAEVVRATRGRTTLDSLLLTMARQPAVPLAGGLTAAMIYRELGATIGVDSARAIVERGLAGGAIVLPGDALAACITPALVERSRWDPGFDIDASLAGRRVLGVRPNGPAARAGLRDSLRIVGLGASRGDATKQLSLRVVEAGDTTLIRYLPAGASVTVQQWSVNNDCRSR